MKRRPVVGWPTQQTLALFLVAALATMTLIETTPDRVSATATAAGSAGAGGPPSSAAVDDWDDPAEEEEGYCAPYNGKVCKAFVNSRQVWYSREDGTGGWENEKITAALFRDLINDLPDYCRPAAERMLCAYAFPQCVIKDGVTMRLPLCYEDCVATHLQFCYNDWALIDEKKERGDVIKSRGHFRLPNCEELPRYNKSARPPTCSHVGLTELIQEEATYDCRMGNGRYYIGTVNVTATGIPCQKWDSQEPHSHHKPPLVFGELQDAENYCRNAGGEEPTPWCYTTDKTVRWQACDIPLCPNSTDMIATKKPLIRSSTPVKRTSNTFPKRQPASVTSQRNSGSQSTVRKANPRNRRLHLTLFEPCGHVNGS